MSDPVITVQGLSKSYILNHQKEAHYSTFRESLTRGVKRFGSKVFKGKSFFHEKEEFWALKDVNFDIKQGDRLGIIGRNGAGKSTLLKLLSRITEPTKGRIKIKGRVAALLEVGTGFHPELTGRENIFLNGAVLGMGRQEIKKKFDEIVAFADVENFLDTPVKRYSSGMYVRLAFAVAAHLEPEILVVDEVLAVGDAQFQKKCLGKMEEVGNEGRTVIFVSHNMGLVQDLCTRAILLDNGHKRMDDRTDDVISGYLKYGYNHDGSISWTEEDKPQNEYLAFKKVSLLDENGQDRSVFQGNEKITINFLIEVIEPIEGLSLNLYIMSSSGIVVFSSTSLKLLKEIRLVQGTYNIKCAVPPNLMNYGKFYLRAGASIPSCGRVLFKTMELLKFEIDSYVHLDFERGIRWPGIFCPLLDWEVIDAD